MKIFRSAYGLLYASLCLSLPSSAWADPVHPSCGETAEQDLGGYTFPITTSKPRVQELFDQGINWAYGFHHSAAAEKFEQAIALDPNCAICYWGLSYVQGPNINAPMTEEAVPIAYQSLLQAQAKASLASPKEQALIKALSKRYVDEVLLDRSHLDRAYALALKEVARSYPDDLDIATLSVEATMDTMPWNYWTQSGEAREGTEEMISTLQGILGKNPLHPGANHFLIHVVERFRPQLAEAAADRLVNLVPAAGHMQHMASHIYIRLGRYHDASRVNQLAIQADQQLLAHCPSSPGFYEALYVPHNYDFLIASATLEGRQELAQTTAQQLRDYIAPFATQSPETLDLQQFWSAPLMTALRFEQWDTVLKEPLPPDTWIYARGLWHVARAVALAQSERFTEASSEIGQLSKLLMAPQLKAYPLAGLNPADQVLSIGREEAMGILNLRRGRFSQAIDHLSRAVQIQDNLTYIEPPAWYRSLRLPLAEAYLRSQRYEEAMETYQRDLKEFPKNGWALFGLYQTLEMQQLLVGASQIYEQFESSWRYADYELQKFVMSPSEEDRISAEP